MEIPKTKRGFGIICANPESSEHMHVHWSGLHSMFDNVFSSVGCTTNPTDHVPPRSHITLLFYFWPVISWSCLWSCRFLMVYICPRSSLHYRRFHLHPTVIITLSTSSLPITQLYSLSAIYHPAFFLVPQIAISKIFCHSRNPTRPFLFRSDFVVSWRRNAGASYKFYCRKLSAFEQWKIFKFCPPSWSKGR